MTQTFFEKSTGENYHQISSAAHSLLKKELARYLSLDADEVVIAKDEKGCPYVEGKKDIFISISHCNGYIMCAFSDDKIGVDVELVKKRRKSVESRVFTEVEISLLNKSENEDRAFYTLWTLKESYLKAIGTGFADNAKDVEFYSLELPIKSNKSEYTFTVGERDGFVYSVCEKKFT